MTYDEFLAELRKVPFKWHITVSKKIRSGRAFSYGPITAVCRMVTGMDYREDSFSELAAAISALKLSPEIAAKITSASNNHLWDAEDKAVRQDLLEASGLIHKSLDLY